MRGADGHILTCRFMAVNTAPPVDNGRCPGVPHVTTPDALWPSSLRAARFPDHEAEVYQNIARWHIRGLDTLNHRLNCSGAQLVKRLVNRGQGHPDKISVLNVVEPN